MDKIIIQSEVAEYLITDKVNIAPLYLRYSPPD